MFFKENMNLVDLSYDEIRQNLSSMRVRMRNNPVNIKTAYCGNCQYNDEIKEYYESTKYPFCDCVIGTMPILLKSTNGRTNGGETLPKYCVNINIDILEEGNVCPPNAYIEIIPRYDIMIFQERRPTANDFGRDIELGRKITLIGDISIEYYQEIENLRNTNNKIINMFNPVNFYRKYRINVIDMYYTFLHMEWIRLLEESMNNVNILRDNINNNIFNFVHDRNHLHIQNDDEITERTRSDSQETVVLYE